MADITFGRVVVTLSRLLTTGTTRSMYLHTYLADAEYKPTGSALDTASIVLPGTQDSGFSSFTFVIGYVAQTTSNYCFIFSVPDIASDNSEGQVLIRRASSVAEDQRGIFSGDGGSSYSVSLTIMPSYALYDSAFGGNVLSSSSESILNAIPIRGNVQAGFCWIQVSGNPPEQADSPFPEDAETSVPPGMSIPLLWKDPGSGEANAATGFDVWVDKGIIEGEVKVADNIFDSGTLDGETYFYYYIPEAFHSSGSYLKTLTSYTWWIVSKNADGDTEGVHWTFSTSGTVGLGKPIEPTPATGATAISPTLSTLSWKNGGGASSFNIYFGTSGNLSFVRSVDADSLSLFAVQSISGGLLPLKGSTTHAWRVDAVNALGSVTGDEWTFATSTLISPINTASNMMATRRILLAAADDTIWYEE